jgi:hypothetical protein
VRRRSGYVTAPTATFNPASHCFWIPEIRIRMIDRTTWLLWTTGLGEVAARDALLMLGLARSVPVDGVVVWIADSDVSAITATDAAAVRGTIEDDTCVWISPEDDPRWVARELVNDERLGSVVVAIDRPVGSLRRRPWRWPLRISVLGMSRVQVAATRAETDAAQNSIRPALFQLSRAEDDPGAVDVLVVAGPLPEATAAVLRSGQVANAIVVLEGADRDWVLTLAQVGSLRAATSASVVAFASPTVNPLGYSISQLVAEMSRREPIDVALTRGFARQALVMAETDALGLSRLDVVAKGLVTEANVFGESFRSSEVYLSLPRRGFSLTLPVAVRGLRAAASNPFGAESGMADSVALFAPVVLDGVSKAGGDRRLHALVESPGAEINMLQAGVDHDVSVWIGPVDAGPALSLDQPFPDWYLPWQGNEAFRLTVVFAPTAPLGESQRAELELGRAGSTQRASFRWRVPAGVASAEARIVVLFRNRVLQTGVLSGEVGGESELSQWVGLRRHLGDLDDRRPFDAAVVLNHTSDGTKRLIANAAGHATVVDGDAVFAVSRRLAKRLEGAVGIRRTKTLGARHAKLLAELAIDGKDLFETLIERTSGVLAGAQRIQIVRMRSDWVFPLELVYDRPAPTLTAKLCPTFQTGVETCVGCANHASTQFVCPNGFWGLSKSIERLYPDPADIDEVAGYVVLFEPTVDNRDIPVTSVAFAAAEQVPVALQDRLVAALRVGDAQADTWDEWQATLAAREADLLVLLPHTDYDGPSLFIGDHVELRRGQIEAPLVTGGHVTLMPMLVLFGCETAGTGDDPAGFASRFISKGAAVVFTSLTKLLGSHASELAERLGVLLLDSERATMSLAELVTRFRQDAVRSGLVAALAVCAYGDADWRV